MSEIFVSYARSTSKQAHAVAEALRAMGYSVWRDDELPAHRTYAEVIEERLRSARAVVVIWSADAVKSQWVRAEADLAREAGTLVQLSLDGAPPPLPFNQIQCAEMNGWNGDVNVPGWRKVTGSVADLTGGPGASVVSSSISSPSLPTKPSIAVLPFTDLRGSIGQDYFADGMVEEIVAALSRAKSIFVVGSGSSLSFKGKAVSPQAAASSLGVRYVLEGSVRKADARVRIAVKLTDAVDGAQIWADRFDGTLEDIFALQDRVALSVAGVIEPAVQSAEIRRASRRPTDNMGSYDLYLRATPLSRTYVRHEMFAALDLLHRAINLDPDYGLALALAAWCHGQVLSSGWSDDPKGCRGQAVDLAQRALQVASDDPEVLIFAGNALSVAGKDIGAATALIDRSITLNPGSSLAWHASGLVRMEAGEAELAVEHFQTSMRLDPLSPIRPHQLTGMGIARFEQGRFGEAVTLLRECAQLLPSHAVVYAILAACYGHLRQASAAQAALARFQSLSPIQIHKGAKWFQHPDHRKSFLDGIALAEVQSDISAAV